MLEALITWRHKGERPEAGKRCGDVLNVALPGHPWGKKDLQIHTVVELEDAELEAVLQARRKAGEAWPVLSLPYATYKPDPVTGLPVLDQRSEFRVDAATMSAEARNPALLLIGPVRQRDGRRVRRASMLADRSAIVEGLDRG